MGIGKRFVKSHKDPQGAPPGTYEQTTDFKKHKDSRAYTFGISREAYKNVYVKENTTIDKCVPGPGAYQPNYRPK
jgi:hypothetical protein